MLYPTFKQVAIVSVNRTVLWQNSQSEIPEASEREKLINEVVNGSFPYQIIREKNTVILYTYYPLIKENSLIGIVEIVDIDNKSDFTFDQNKARN